MNPKEFTKRLKEGYTKLQPIDFARAGMQGYYWGVIGMIFGGAFMVVRGLWYWLPFIIAMVWLQWWNYRKERQRYYNLKKMQDLIKQQEKDQTTLNVEQFKGTVFDDNR